MNIKCFQIEMILHPIAPEFSVKYLVLFNTSLFILLYINYILYYVNYNLYIYINYQNGGLLGFSLGLV